MEKIFMRTNLDKINTKEELIYFLGCHKGVLNNIMIEYLKSLINLEFSVIKEYISDKDRLVLSELEIYKNIAKFNIYYKALNIFEKNKSELKISGNDEGIEGLNVYGLFGQDLITLFDYDYRTISAGITIPSEDKKMKIGDVSLYRTIVSDEQIKKEIDRIKSKLDDLWREKNPYSYGHSDQFEFNGLIDGNASQWEFKRRSEIMEYSEMLKKLENKKNITDYEKREIEITKKYCDLLLDDYGLINDRFEINNKKCSSIISEEKETNKILVKKMPNINVRYNIKYI